MRIFNSLAVLAAAGWAGSAAAQSVLSSIPLTAVGTGFGTAIAGPMMGYAKGNIYTCSSGGDNVVWKVATGNGDGPSETATMSNINYLTLPNNCYFGVVDSNGFGYWILDSYTEIAKTSGNEGSADMTLVGVEDYASELTPSTFPNEFMTAALDEKNGILYVGSTNGVFKFSLGGPSDMPTLIQHLPADAAEDDPSNTAVYSIIVDPKTGYGYYGLSDDGPAVVMFSLGTPTGPMTRIGRVDVSLGDIYAMAYDRKSGTLYVSAGYGQPTVLVMSTSSTGALPTAVNGFAFAATGPFPYGVNSQDALLESCGFLVGQTGGDPMYLNVYDITTDPANPALVTTVDFSPAAYGLGGAIDEYGYSYWVDGTFGTPNNIYKVSPLPGYVDCREYGPTAGGPFSLTNTKVPAKRGARSGTSFKVTFALSRWAAGYPYEEKRRRQLAGYGQGKTWEYYDVVISLPEEGAALKGKPRVAPRIPQRKGADVANNTLIAWHSVPMRVLPGTTRNYTRKFSFAVKVDKTFVGNLTFAAAAVGPEDGWYRESMVTVPVTRK